MGLLYTPRLSLNSGQHTPWSKLKLGGIPGVYYLDTKLKLQDTKLKLQILFCALCVPLKPADPTDPPADPTDLYTFIQIYHLLKNFLGNHAFTLFLLFSLVYLYKGIKKKDCT